MWSVFSEPVDIYLGQSTALIKWGSAASLVVVHAPTQPMDQVLTQLSGEAKDYLANLRVKPTRCRLWLSAALCPAIHVDLPKGLKDWREQQEIAIAAAAATMGQSQQDVVCVAAAGNYSIAAAVSKSVHARLMAWAADQGWRVVSLAPIWALASQSKAASASTINGVVVQEADSTSIFAQGLDNSRAATTLVGSDREATDILVRRWLVGRGFAERDLLRLTFSDRSVSTMANGPAIWVNHWVRV